jgi:hypothetical protein
MSEDKRDEIGILKSIWRKNDKGIWIVHDLQSLYLRPREGFEKDYFKVNNDNLNLLTQQPGKVFENIFATFGTTEFLVRQSIVPIISWNEGDQEARCIGTGFFISASGLLMTAAHVLRDPVEEKYTSVTQVGKNAFKLHESLRFGVLLPANPAMKGAPFLKADAPIRSAKWFMAPFEWAYHWGREVASPLLHQKPEYKIDIDVAVCKVKDNILGGSYQPLNIGLHKLNVGDRAVAIGYADMKNIPFQSNEDYQPELTVSVGTVKNIYPDNITEKLTSTPGPCFDFDAKIPGKMSGSPILVGTGILTKGIVSRSWQDEKHASGCLIAPVMSLPLAHGLSILEMMHNGNEGIAKIHGNI